MKILILANNDIGLYKFRKELVEELLKKNKVYICLPDGECIKEFCVMGCSFIDCKYLERHGTNPLKEVRLICFYEQLLRKIKPDIVLTYTIKPNVYGGMVCSRLGIPYIANITGLGTAVENGGLMQRLTLILYKLGLKKAQKVFFQNKENMDFMTERNVVTGSCALLPGSGVNLEQFSLMEYPKTEDPIIFVTIGRLLKVKGTGELLKAAKIIKGRHPKVIFRLIGMCDEEIYREKVNRAVKAGIVEYFGNQMDVKPFIRESHAIIHAGYHEGMSNVLLESAACGRPVIATDIPGCIETFTPGISGITCKAGDVESLVNAIEKFIKLPLAEKQKMGQAGRSKMEAEFDRNIVVDMYMKEIYRETNQHKRNTGISQTIGF